MSITRSVEFYCGKKCIEKQNLFGGKFLDYEFTLDIAYKDIDWFYAKDLLINFMKKHNIKIGYCDVSADFGGGYSLFKRYTFVNKEGTFITKKQKYGY